MADTARVEADQIEVLGDRAAGDGVGEVDHRVDRRGAGTARVDEQRAEPLAGRRNLDDRQLRLRPSRIRLVDRNRHARALGTGQIGVLDDVLTALPDRDGCALSGSGSRGGLSGRDDDRHCGAEEPVEHRCRADSTRACHGGNRGTAKCRRQRRTITRRSQYRSGFSRLRLRAAASGRSGTPRRSRRRTAVPGRRPCAEFR